MILTMFRPARNLRDHRVRMRAFRFRSWEMERGRWGLAWVSEAGDRIGVAVFRTLNDDPFAHDGT